LLVKSLQATLLSFSHPGAFSNDVKYIAQKYSTKLSRLKEVPLSAIEARLQSLGFELPDPPTPGGNYVPFVVHDRFVFLAGVISIFNGLLIAGTVGADKSIQDGYEAARACALIQLANLKLALGDLDRLQRIISLNGYVNAVPGFAESPQVINGASDLLVELLGSRGLHARAAIGVPALPKNALVEIQMIATME
jgi:enamine deaminase RidA (YjgF/YER057c/UK114 family)